MTILLVSCTFHSFVFAWYRRLVIVKVNLFGARCFCSGIYLCIKLRKYFIWTTGEKKFALKITSRILTTSESIVHKYKKSNWKRKNFYSQHMNIQFLSITCSNLVIACSTLARNPICRSNRTNYTWFQIMQSPFHKIFRESPKLDVAGIQDRSTVHVLLRFVSKIF